MKLKWDLLMAVRAGATRKTADNNKVLTSRPWRRHWNCPQNGGVGLGTAYPWPAPQYGAKYESGGGGMMSTAEDYLRFTISLANGGVFQVKRVIGRQRLSFMTADHTLDRSGRPPGLGFGLGFEVRTRVGDSALPSSVGEYGWAGNAGTLFWIDPKEQLIAVYMVQVSDPDRVALRNQFRTMVQAAIID